MSEKSRFRMTIPRKEEDYQKIEEEIHEETHKHEHHHHNEHIEFETPEDMQILLLNAIAHTLGHIEASINSINSTMKNLSKDLEDLKETLNNVVKVLLLNEVQSKELKKKLLAEILENLIEE